MVPGLNCDTQAVTAYSDAELHVLIAARDPASRYSIADLLLDAGFRVTMAATFGVVEILLDDGDLFDLMVTAQSVEEITRFGLPQLARSVAPDLPILVLDFETANSPSIVELAHAALSRWPLRDRESRPLH